MALFEDDGCTLFPDGTWRTCCDIHDAAYSVGTTLQEFIAANDALISCVWGYNHLAAIVMGIGVFTGGALFFFFGVKKRPVAITPLVSYNTANKEVIAMPTTRKTATTRKPAPKATADAFRDALARLLVHEGGAVNDPRDPGGRTNKGVTQTVYTAWRKRNSLPNRDVFDIADNEVEAIYRTQYWNAIQGDQLPRGVSYAVFDGAVNSGPGQAIKWLQRGLGPLYAGKVDGIIGNLTIQAVNAHPDHDRLIADMLARRMLFLQALKTWPVYHNGWTARVEEVKATAQAWASGSVAVPEAEYHPGGDAKASISDAKDLPPQALGDGAAGAGGATVLGGGLIQNVREQLEPYAAQFGFVSTIVMWLVIAGVVVGVAGIGYRLWAKRKADKLNDALDRGAA